VASGQLVSDDLVNDVVLERLDQHDWNYGFILDGFPRNEAQPTFFLERYDVDTVVQLEVPDQLVLDRISSIAEIQEQVRGRWNLPLRVAA
jgi:adenylate kinase